MTDPYDKREEHRVQQSLCFNLYDPRFVELGKKSMKNRTKKKTNVSVDVLRRAIDGTK